MIYNSSATPSTSCKTDIIISNKMQATPTRVRDVAKARWSGAALLFGLKFCIYGSIIIVQPRVDYQWQWLAGKERFLTRRRFPPLLRLLIGM